MKGAVIRMDRVTRGFVRENPDKVFLFGDNMARAGFGGQAAAMRGEPNTIGVPTKWRPERSPGSYFRDKDWGAPEVRGAIVQAFDLAQACLDGGRDVVVPADGLGTGLAELPERAPKIHAWIEARIAALEGGAP